MDGVNGIKLLAAVSLLSAMLGTIHAFSVFLAPIEQGFGVSRAAASFTYAGALAMLTFAVLIGHRLYTALPPTGLLVATSALAAGGLLMASLAPSIHMVWLGYSVIFGFANGLGYGYAMQAAAQANPSRQGLAMGVVTAAYALGAVLAPLVFASVFGGAGFSRAMFLTALLFLVVGSVSAHWARRSGFTYRGEIQTNDAIAAETRTQGLLWLGYGTGCAAGLMTIGHAGGLVSAAGFAQLAWLAPVVIAVFNLCGSILSGQLSDRLPPVLLTILLPACAAVAVVASAVDAGALALFLALAVIGFSYGGLIAAYPAMIIKNFGADASPRIYGRIFTAWGTAGLLAPWAAGALFDWQQSYLLALHLAAALALVSTAAAGLASRRLRQSDDQ